MSHRIWATIAAALFGGFIVAGVRVWVVTHQSSGGGWTVLRYLIAGSVLWSLAMFCLAAAVASIPRKGPG